MVNLNSKGEVANFVDRVNQFQAGKSAYECVAFGCSLIWHSVAPDKQNTYTIDDVVKMAEYWYGYEEGSNTASNTNGMSLGQEHDVLNRMGLRWNDLGVNESSQHNADMQSVERALQAGYPVLICGHENGFYYANGDRVPYSWTPSGNHCIVATGIAASGNFLVRDYASLVPADNYTPDLVQEYDNSKMFLISATAIVPSWLQASPPPVTTPPTAVPAWQQQAIDTWNSNTCGAWRDTGIYAVWLKMYQKIMLGVPIGKEYKTVDWGNKPITVQQFSGGYRVEWSSPSTGRVYNSANQLIATL